MRTSIHEDCGFVAVLQGVGEIEAANAEVGYAHGLRQLQAGHAANYFHTESVVAEEDVADAGNEDGWFLHGGDLREIIGREWLDFFRVEEEAMAGLTKQAHILARVVVENYADVLLAFVILFDAFDGGNLPG